MKSSSMQTARSKFLNYCLRSSAGQAAAPAQVPQIRQRDEQIKGILKVKARERRAQEGEYNKVTNKIKQKYIKIIMQDRGYDISLKSRTKATDKDVSSPSLRSPSTLNSTTKFRFGSTLDSSEAASALKENRVADWKAKGTEVQFSLDSLHRQISQEKKQFDEQLLIKKVNEMNKRYQIIYGDGLGESSVVG